MSQAAFDYVLVTTGLPNNEEASEEDSKPLTAVCKMNHDLSHCCPKCTPAPLPCSHPIFTSLVLYPKRRCVPAAQRLVFFSIRSVLSRIFRKEISFVCPLLWSHPLPSPPALGCFFYSACLAALTPGSRAVRSCLHVLLGLM